MKTSGKAKIAKTPTFDTDGYQTNLADLNGTVLPKLSQAKAQPLNWGGARSGAGRKPSGRKPVLLRLTPATLRALRKTARAEGKTLSDLAEEKLAAG